MELRAARGAWARGRAGCLANLGLKLVAVLIAVVVYVLVHRPGGEPPPAPPPPGSCPP